MLSYTLYLLNGFKILNSSWTQVENSLSVVQLETRDLLEEKLLLTLMEVGENTAEEHFLVRTHQKLIDLLLML